MRAQGQSTTQQECDHLYAAIEIAEGCSGEYGAGGDSDEGMNYVPDAVDELDLVGDKLDQEQDQRDTNHPPVRHDLKVAWEFQMRKAPEQTQRSYSRVEIYSGNPGGAHADCQCGNEVHREDYTIAAGVRFAQVARRRIKTEGILQTFR